MYTLYRYPKCLTCKKAKVQLDQHDVSYQTVDMIKEVPKASTIETWLETSQISIHHLFNTGGIKYREFGLRDQVGKSTASKASQVLPTDGTPIKRPLIVQEDQPVVIGFNEKVYGEELI